MPTFSRSLEQSLHRALAIANERHHEYATLEHLLLALIDDQDASAVMRACNVDLDKLRRSLVAYLESELENLITDGAEDSKPTAGFQRVIQRAVIHVQSSRPRGGHRRQRAGGDLRRAREPRRLFPARAGHDALRRGQLHQPRHRQAAGPLGIAPGARRRGGGRHQGRRRAQEEGRRARCLLRQPQQEGQGRQDRSADRPRRRDQPHHPGALPPAEEQSAVRRRCRRRQDRDRGRAGAPHRARRGAGRAQGRDRVRARHGHALGRHALPRRLRGAAQAGDQGDRSLSGRDHVHRRDPHRDRRRRHLRRRDGCVQPAQAGARLGHASAASARPPTRNTASISRRTARWCAASRRSTSTSRRSPTPSKS